MSPFLLIVCTANVGNRWQSGYLVATQLNGPRAVMLLHLLITVPEVKTNARMIGVDTWHLSNGVAGDMGRVISIRSSLTTIDFNTNVSNNQALGFV
jgi:hypothetical protein